MHRPAITRQRRHLIVGLSVAALLAVVVGVGALGDDEPAIAGTELASGAIEFFDGGKGDLADYRGQPLVLNFWASWCPACVSELPEFQSIHERFGEEVVIVGVANADRREASVELAADVGLSYPLADDPAGDLFRSLDLIAMPSTVFIGADGEIDEVFGGVLDEEALAERIDALIGAA